jgi:hypothetical protein
MWCPRCRVDKCKYHGSYDIGTALIAASAVKLSEGHSAFSAEHRRRADRSTNYAQGGPYQNTGDMTFYSERLAPGPGATKQADTTTAEYETLLNQTLTYPNIPDGSTWSM